MEQNNERWLSDGNCNKCRRQKYCKKQCKANVARVNNAITRAILDTPSGRVLNTFMRLGGKI